jgi:hypothetical protein
LIIFLAGVIRCGGGHYGAGLGITVQLVSGVDEPQQIITKAGGEREPMNGI